MNVLRFKLFGTDHLTDGAIAETSQSPLAKTLIAARARQVARATKVWPGAGTVVARQGSDVGSTRAFINSAAACAYS
jgi:hypothetical protein